MSELFICHRTIYVSGKNISFANLVYFVLAKYLSVLNSNDKISDVEIKFKGTFFSLHPLKTSENSIKIIFFQSRIKYVHSYRCMITECFFFM